MELKDSGQAELPAICTEAQQLQLLSAASTILKARPDWVGFAKWVA
jgi:hypothetical protein